jgi:anti-sigma-K factor RskA
MNYLNPERADALAAQYVLGTLRGRARARFVRLLGSERVLADAVSAWEDRLLPFSESLPPVLPPARVWQQIRARIQDDRVPAEAPGSVWGNLALWRGLTLAGFATALALAIVLLSPPVERPEQTLVTVLAGPDAKPVMVASVDRTGRTLQVKPLASVELAPDRALELWALPQGGNPRSLGLISPSGVAQIRLPEPAETALAQVPALAVSLEPRGGSPTGLPTGPVLYSGPIQRMY